MQTNLIWLIVAAFVAVILNFAFYYHVTFRLDQRRKNLIETGTVIQTSFKEIKYRQYRKWNQYLVVTSWTDPKDGTVREFSSDWIRGMAPQDLPKEFKTYVDSANPANYHIDVSGLQAKFFKTAIMISGIAAVFIAVASIIMIMTGRKPV